MATTVRNALAAKQNTLAALIERQKSEIARALPKHLDPDRLARIATTVMRQTPQLGLATSSSFLGGLMTCAQLGLEPGPLGLAYLVPFKNHERGCSNRRDCNCVVEVQFIAGYRGLIALARRSREVTKVRGYVVREGDEFDYNFGLVPNLFHRPCGRLTEVTNAYAVVKLRDEPEPDFDVMTREEVDAVRTRSKAANNGPWVTDYPEMSKKTVLRRTLKVVPMSIEYDRAVAQDGQVRYDIDAEAMDITPPEIDADVKTEPDEPEQWPETALPPTDPAGP